MRPSATASPRGRILAAQLTIDVKKNNSGWNRYSYLKFDIASIASVSTAKLRLYGKLDNADAKNIPIEVFGVSSTTWAENTINWNNKPATGTTAIGKFTVTDTTARYYEVDISKYVKDQKAAGKTVIAIALKSNVFTSPLAVFNSDENASNKPQLVVNVPVTTTAAAAARIASDIDVASTSSLWSQLEEEPTGLA